MLVRVTGIVLVKLGVGEGEADVELLCVKVGVNGYDFVLDALDVGEYVLVSVELSELVSVLVGT